MHCYALVSAGAEIPPFGGEDTTMRYSPEDQMQTLLAAPEAVEVLEKHFPKFLKNPALQMTRFMSLRCVAAFAQSGLSAEQLDQIDAELRKLD